MNLLEKANNYIKNNIDKVRNRPFYHLTPQIGWLNDPNGFCEYKGKYHLFYQTYPYDTIWNDMHWGHAVSNDLIKWEYKDIAMANDTPADKNGCFSGSAIEKNGELFLVYTGNLNNETITQHQCLAKSKDGELFKKIEENPVISKENLPKNYLVSDFRDPKIWEKDGVYYIVTVAKNIKERGEILLYKSLDLIKWKFVSSIFKSRFEDNKMLECPDFFHLDGKDVLIYSGMPCNKFFEGKVENTVEYHIGYLDYNKGIFKSESHGYLDYGDSYYAPQSMLDSSNRRLIVAWMRKWSNQNIKQTVDLKWTGMMSMVRELKIIDGKLSQIPLKEFEKYTNLELEINNKIVEKEEILYKNKISPKKISFILEDLNEKIELNIFDETKFVFEPNKLIYISDYYEKIEEYFLKEIRNNKKKVKVEIYIDLYSIEILINDGIYSFSYVNFNPHKNILVKFKSNQIFCMKNFKVFNLDNLNLTL